MYKFMQGKYTGLQIVDLNNLTRAEVSKNSPVQVCNSGVFFPYLHVTLYFIALTGDKKVNNVFLL